MANAIPCEINLPITATTDVTDWKPSLGADSFVLHLQTTSGDCVVELQACNLVTETPKVVLTATTGTAPDDIYAEMAAGLRYPYRYWRLKVDSGTTPVARAVATGTRKSG